MGKKWRQAEGGGKLPAPPPAEEVPLSRKEPGLLTQPKPGCGGVPARSRGHMTLSVVVLGLATALSLGLVIPAQDALSQSPPAKRPAGEARAVGPGAKADAERCPAPCSNRARAVLVSPADVMKGELMIDCASVHFGGFIPGYGGFEIFGVGQNACPAVETYIPAHYGSIPAPCRDCEWQDGATIRERENTCSQEVNFIFFAMPNCVRGEWVNTSERVRTCGKETICHRDAEAGRSPEGVPRGGRP